MYVHGSVKGKNVSFLIVEHCGQDDYIYIYIYICVINCIFREKIKKKINRCYTPDETSLLPT